MGAEERHHFTVRTDEVGVRVDRLVVAWLEAKGRPTNRAEVHRWCEGGRVQRRDGPTPVRLHKGAKLPLGAVVAVEPAPPPLSHALPDPSVRFDIVFEDPHLLVVDKPAGCVVHPARGHRTGTLVNGLLALGRFDADNADPRDREGHLRPGIVHRLDKDTSGLLVVAKTAATREGLKALFQTHDIERSYLALVAGTAHAARYDTTHGRHPLRRLCFTSLLPDRDERGRARKRAQTDVVVVERFGALATLVRCTIQTGRTHQIRVHLLERGRTPILGDPLYGPRGLSAPLHPIVATLPGQALHAEVLGFTHPVTGRAHRWSCPPPRAVRRALAELREAARSSP
ncbi:MAG: RluA family pseudouridine synthase [Myxococcota bacterium]